MLLSTDGSV